MFLLFFMTVEVGVNATIKPIEVIRTVPARQTKSTSPTNKEKGVDVNKQTERGEYNSAFD